MSPNQPAQVNDPFKGIKTGKWTKYGGAVHGMIQEDVGESWSCQCCGVNMPGELKPFLYELFAGDFLRVCNGCINKLMAKKGDSVEVLRTVVRVVRKQITYY